MLVTDKRERERGYVIMGYTVTLRCPMYLSNNMDDDITMGADNLFDVFKLIIKYRKKYREIVVRSR